MRARIFRNGKGAQMNLVKTTELPYFSAKSRSFSQKRMNTEVNLIKQSCIHYFLKTFWNDTRQNKRAYQNLRFVYKGINKMLCRYKHNCILFFVHNMILYISMVNGKLKNKNFLYIFLYKCNCLYLNNFFANKFASDR